MTTYNITFIFILAQDVSRSVVVPLLLISNNQKKPMILSAIINISKNILILKIVNTLSRLLVSAGKPLDAAYTNMHEIISHRPNKIKKDIT